MRVAFFSPLPPARSGIADYSAALIEPLGRLLELEVISRPDPSFRPDASGLAVYQIGNNACHDFVYEAALRHPGVTVLHEANLHHLIAEITIRRGDWDAYMREVEYDGGAEALEFAGRVRALEAGPDYGGVPMLRRILERSRAIIVHSEFMRGQIRARSFAGPIARIPHGAWVSPGRRHEYRQRLGLDDTTPLVGIFGYLKPYKRIPQSLRAFRRLLRLEPNCRMILVGEPHPDLPVRELVRTLGLSASVRVLGFVPEEQFPGYMSSCDVILNLRHPTVGESSGTLMRALGMGIPALVSDVGSFSELPDGVCFKVPAGDSEEEFIFEYMRLLVSKPDLARHAGETARRWGEQWCRWEVVARSYASFLESVFRGEGWEEPKEAATEATSGVGAPAKASPSGEGPVELEYILGWSPATPGGREYVESHLSRLERTVAITPPGGPEDAILEMGAYLQITPALRTRLGYGTVRGSYYGPAGHTQRKTVKSSSGESFECEIDLFDAERERFPYDDGVFTTVLCCEVIEHLTVDPMHMMAEINRILKPGGHLVLTTPNITSLRAIGAILTGYHPGFFPAYVRKEGGGAPDPRHAREYTPGEIRELLEDAGFDVIRLETGSFRQAPAPEILWVERVLERLRLSTGLRGDDIFAVGCKRGPLRHRYPQWLYHSC